MNITFRYSDSRRVDGLLLSASEERMRVVGPHMTDTLELRRQSGHWIAEDAAVEIESILWDGRPAIYEEAPPASATDN